MDEKRKYDRLPKEIKVKYEKVSFPIFDVSSKINAIASNIGLGGIAIACKTKFDIGDAVNLDITIPEYYKFSTSYKYTESITDSAIHAIGKVRYQLRKGNGRYETGIEFTSIDHDDMTGLRNYINKKKDGSNDRS